jgi:hypothetical protein
MDDFLKAAHRASHGQSSFPRYVADLIIAACNRGATDVVVHFSDGDIEISDNGRHMTIDEMRRELSYNQKFDSGTVKSDAGKLLGFLHHAELVLVWMDDVYYQIKRGDLPYLDALTVHAVTPEFRDRHPNSVYLMSLSQGLGVNPAQQRTAKRLMAQLPALLSTREMGRVLIQEGVMSYRLCQDVRDPLPWNEEFLVWLPFKLVDRKMFNFQSVPLLLKVGGVRVPLRKVVERVMPDAASLNEYSQLLSPWLSGIIEITNVDGSVEFLEASDDFSEEAYKNGYVAHLVEVLLIVGTHKIFQEEFLHMMVQLMEDAFGEKRSVTFGDMEYILAVEKGTHPYNHVYGPIAEIGTIEFGACASVYHVDNRVDAIIERLYWQTAFALWETTYGEGDLQQIYLDLRKTFANPR